MACPHHKSEKRKQKLHIFAQLSETHYTELGKYEEQIPSYKQKPKPLACEFNGRLVNIQER